MDVTGTWETVLTAVNEPVLTPTVNAAGLTIQSHVARGAWAAWGGTPAGEALEWFRARCGHEAKAEAAKRGISDWDYFTELAEAYHQRGLIHRETGSEEKALADFSQAIELDQSSPEPYFQRAELYLGLAEYQNAIPDLDQVISLDPQNALAYAHRAEAYFRRETRSRTWNFCGPEPPQNPDLETALRHVLGR